MATDDDQWEYWETDPDERPRQGDGWIFVRHIQVSGRTMIRWRRPKQQEQETV